MDKSERDFLLECQNELAFLKDRIGALEERIAAMLEEPQELAAPVPEEAVEVDFTDMEIGVDVTPEPVVAVEPEPADTQNEPVVESDPVIESDPVVLNPPVILSEAKNLPDDTEHYPWRKDNPGMLVKNIRSGISLLDRAQFIGTLFQEDFSLYDSTIACLNEMDNLDQAVAYVKEHFPQWNLGSDVVYRFMMAVRKKLG